MIGRVAPSNQASYSFPVYGKSLISSPLPVMGRGVFFV
nr:MAG TPA: hypothetical protein [Caudoviricetes sp.]